MIPLDESVLLLYPATSLTFVKTPNGMTAQQLVACEAATRC